MSENLDFKNWRNFDDATLRRIYGPEKYAENRAAAVHRQNLKTNNFLKGFAGALLSPVTNTLGALGVPGAVGWGYGNPQNANKVAPQPWIIDENTGAVIANPALSQVDDYLAGHQAKQEYLNTNNLQQIVANDIEAVNAAKPVIEKVEEFLSPRDQWLQDTSKSPAARSRTHGKPTFSDEERWQTHLKNQQWRKDKGRSYTHGDFLN